MGAFAINVTINFAISGRMFDLMFHFEIVLRVIVLISDVNSRSLLISVIRLSVIINLMFHMFRAVIIIKCSTLFPLVSYCF